MAVTTGKTVTAKGLVESIGVNTHVPYTDGNYASTSLIAANLNYLGLDQVRDQISNGESGTAFISAYEALANQGVKFTIYIEGSSNSDVLGRLSLVDTLEKYHPGDITAIEGPNEINNQTIYYTTSSGKVESGITGGEDLQKAIYADVKADANLAGVSVDYLTGYDAYDNQTQSTVGQGDDPTLTSGLADYDNQHPYPNFGDAPHIALSRLTALTNAPSDYTTEPTVFTETGYASIVPGTSYNTGQVSEATQAKYTLDLIMDAVSEGVAKTYIYELMDAYAPGSRQGDYGNGLFSYVGTDSDKAKPVAVAIHNLTTLLSDPGANAATFTPVQLNYTVSNLPSTGNTMAVEKSDGSYYIAVWAEPQITSNSGKTDVAAPTENVTINLPSGFTASKIYDPYTGTTTAASGTSVTASLSDHPVFIEADPKTACYHRGTHILTVAGDVRVEELKIGDEVITRSGASRPIKWIGRRSYGGRMVRSSMSLAPVCFRAGSLADNVPKRDLWVSPQHCMYLEGALIPAALLVNDQSIVRITEDDDVHYFHVELQSHDVIVAEGAYSESFYDQDGRSMFQNARQFETLYPAKIGAPSGYFAPRLEEGFELEALRETLKGRAARLQSNGVATSVALDGFLDVADRTHVAGWARDRLAPDRRVGVVALCNGVVVARTEADLYREDLFSAGLGDGRHAFDLSWEIPFAADVRHEIELRYVDDFTLLEGSPVYIEPEINSAITPLGELQGHFDLASSDGLTGWALDIASPHQPVGLVITIDEVVVARVLANRYRDDLDKLQIGTGRHAFEFKFSEALSPGRDHVIGVQREIDRVHLQNSPQTVRSVGKEAQPLESMLADCLDQAAEVDHVEALSLLKALSNRLGKTTQVRPSSAAAPLRRAG